MKYCWPVLLTLSFVLLPFAARAQSLDADLSELRARLDHLERENAALRTAVEQRLGEIAPANTAAFVDAATAPPADPGTVVGQDLTMAARWNNGLEVATKDKAFRIHVGGRWQFDTSWLDADQAVQQNLPGNVMYHDGVDFRRARLRIDGTMYEVIEFAAEYDFGNGLRDRNGDNTGIQDVNITAITDLWLQYSHTPIGNIRVGNQKEPIGFEHLVSSRFLPFMERSYDQDAFYGGFFNGFTPGISATKNVLEDRASWSLGLFKPTNNVFGFSTNDGDYAVTGRLTALPIYASDARQLLHLGVSGRQATTYDGRIRYRTRDAIRAGLATQWPVPADVNVFGSTAQTINFELAAVQGPWTLQAEWLVNLTQNAHPAVNGQPVGPARDNVLYQGGYVQLLYYLTGETDTYSLEKMAFDRLKPFENFFWVHGADGGSLFGKGAWQIGARYNYLDLNDQGINGGILHNLTLGLNWFFNPNMKWQFNYIATHRDVSQTTTFPSGSGWINGWGMRFAQDF